MLRRARVPARTGAGHPRSGRAEVFAAASAAVRPARRADPLVRPGQRGRRLEFDSYMR